MAHYGLWRLQNRLSAWKNEVRRLDGHRRIKDKKARIAVAKGAVKKLEALIASHPFAEGFGHNKE